MNKEKNVEQFLLLTFDAILDNSPDLIFIKDIDLRYMGASKTFSRVAGYEDGKGLIGKTDHDLFDWDLAERYIADDRALLASRTSIIDNVEPLPDQDGKKNYSSTSKYLIYDNEGNIIGLYGYGRDVTAQVELEEEREWRKLSHQIFEDVLEADLTQDKMVRVEGSAWAIKLGLSRNSRFTETIEALACRFIHKDYAQEFRNLYSEERLLRNFEEGNREFSHITYQSNDGETYKWMEFQSQMYYSKISKTIRIVMFLKDLDEEIRDRERLKIKAETDALTGLLNRECVMNRVTECICQSDKKHALLFMDLDGFKQVNDNLGHSFGDKVLQDTAKKLSALFDKDGIVGRVGGDEFLILLKDVRSRQEIEERTEEILKVVPFYQFKNNREIFMTCSVGISMYDDCCKTLEQMYEEADMAMYRSKERGKNTFTFFGE